MKRRLLLSALCLTFLLTSGTRALAAQETDAAVVPLVDEAEFTKTLVEEDGASPSSPETTVDTSSEEAASDASDQEPSDVPEEQETAPFQGPDILVNGVSIAALAHARVYGETTYLSLRAMTTALYPDAQLSWNNQEGAVVKAEGLTLTAKPGQKYLVANGRYLYVPLGVRLEDGVTLVPVRTLAKALGAQVTWDAATRNISIVSTGGPLEPGDTYYKSDAVYWLSRIINAESGSQPLEGKIAVGTVILNRVNSPLFPNTIYEVIFDRRGGVYQFSPAGTGSIHRAPNEESVIAAKLCLDGAREAGNSLFFHAAGRSCWASRNRTLVTTIGGHSFYE